uniref:Uncharacterized LOC100180642 n=1 Tax=Ciona intestinalis TaxID=7719 RepID=H2XJX6_CIOIN|nr:uncharacterized protein LOC100180642 [Ciona intestinalis]|eukprot:XP_002127575.1 uncharacterized protein LOC100180642 [Ciona intestinalis]
MSKVELKNETTTEKSNEKEHSPPDETSNVILAIKVKELDKFVNEASSVTGKYTIETWCPMFKESRNRDKNAIERINEVIQMLETKEKDLTEKKSALFGKLEVVSNNLSHAQPI